MPLKSKSKYLKQTWHLLLCFLPGSWFAISSCAMPKDSMVALAVARRLSRAGSLLVSDWFFVALIVSPTYSINLDQ